RVRAIRDRPGGPAARYRRGRSAVVDAIPGCRPVPSHRHRGSRIRGSGLRAVLPATASKSVVANSIGGVQDEDYVAMGRRIRPPQFGALPPELRELGPSYRAGNPSGTERWKELERMSRPGGPPPAQTLRNRITFTLLEGISVPTLLLTGDADLYA